MKERRSITRVFLWGALGVVILAVITVGIFTNYTLRSVEKNLPGTLLVELGALAYILDDLAEVTTIAELAVQTAAPAQFHKLREKVASSALSKVCTKATTSRLPPVLL